MRQIFLIVSILTTAACSSANKTETQNPSPTANPAPATTKAAEVKATKTPAAPAASAATVECSTKAEKRTLEVRSKDKGCELAYTKGGEEKIVGTAKNGSTYCQEMSDKIKTKLEAAGYTCK